ncbi:MAG: peptide chain release factor N(5)-glutamine methyltransferase [Flavobacteriaceae bacterium]|nr:peptide chain release factor N(5)-glutamine methyltransferase [Flavobacteriaceae bacterium]
MILKTLRTYFNSELLGYYPDTEISSFFHILSEHILKLNQINIALNLYQVVSGKKYDKFQTAIDRLKVYQPIQYILGQTEFYGLKFKVNDSVLIPRPETEELVDWIIKASISKDKIRILDIGTGSGCIAISLAKHLPNAKVLALDISSKALKVAQENAKQNDVDVEFMHKNILSIPNYFLDSQDRFDIIVSNPPYVRQSEKTEMKPNVLENEPHIALFVDDDDALQFYKAIVQLSVNNLNKNGMLFFEINEYLGNEMIKLLQKFEFENIDLKQDLFGKDRMIKATKKA